MLTADGYAKLEELRIEMETGNSAGDLLKLIGKVAGHLRKNNIYDASVVNYNAANIAERINDKRKPAWLLTLTLFVRPEGADLSKWDESEAASWVDDWSAEGYSVSDLFTLANTCQTAFAGDFLRNSLTILQESGEDQQAEK